MSCHWLFFYSKKYQQILLSYYIVIFFVKEPFAKTIRHFF